MLETINRLGKEYTKYRLASINKEDYSRLERFRYAKIANRIRLQLNRLACREDRPPIVYYGDDRYFIDEGAVTGSDIAKSMVLIPRRTIK